MSDKTLWLAAVDLYLLGVTLTFFVLLFLAHQPRFNVGPGRALVASLLWFVTWPLAFVIIRRLRAMLPFARAFKAGEVPIIICARVVSPSPQVWNDLSYLIAAEGKLPYFKVIEE